MIGTEFVDMVGAFVEDAAQDQHHIAEAVRLSADDAVETNQVTPRVDTAGEFASRPR